MNSNGRVTYRASRSLRTIPRSPVELSEILMHLCDRVPLNPNDANQDDPAKATAEIERGHPPNGSRIHATGIVGRNGRNQSIKVRSAMGTRLRRVGTIRTGKSASVPGSHNRVEQENWTLVRF